MKKGALLATFGSVVLPDLEPELITALYLENGTIQTLPLKPCLLGKDGGGLDGFWFHNDEIYYVTSSTMVKEVTANSDIAKMLKPYNISVESDSILIKALKHILPE